MTPNEINLIKTFTELLEQKNETIIKLSIVEAEKKIIDVREEWNNKLGEEEQSHLHTKQELNSLIEQLRTDKFINDKLREKYGIVYDK
jgi:hypothetical protein